ncbi:MAG: hypothetical protein Q9184_005111 [Pyrenodesmia sp. 2 TL-2023]
MQPEPTTVGDFLRAPARLLFRSIPLMQDPQMLQRRQDVRRGLGGLLVVPEVGGVEVGFLSDVAGERGAFDDVVDEPVAFADEVMEVDGVIAVEEGRGVRGVTERLLCGDVVLMERREGVVRFAAVCGSLVGGLRESVSFVPVDDGMSGVMGDCWTDE